ncbi:MAG: hypothetical protein Ta2E_02320 [Mycoplasmoidaceae bacterium]|nr:MAG: hypothetical protein Ta2E_02320 [Mycoplasmoidaceae bacterium]
MSKEQQLKINSAIGNMKLEGYNFNKETIKAVEQIVASSNPKEAADEYIKNITSKYNK